MTAKQLKKIVDKFKKEMWFENVRYLGNKDIDVFEHDKRLIDFCFEYRKMVIELKYCGLISTQQCEYLKSKFSNISYDNQIVIK